MELATWNLKLDAWRERLAKELIAKRPDLSLKALNRLIGRLVLGLLFLRLAERGGLEPADSLDRLLAPGDVGERLWRRMRKAAERYRNDLFYWDGNPGLDGSTLAEFIRELWEAPDVEDTPGLLGRVHEELLGRRIRLDRRRRAVTIETNPALKKSGGIYYTPDFIVGFIVGQTLGRMLGERPPTRDAAPKILDPTCGAGSFLLGAYAYLLDWHLNAYVAHNPRKWAKRADPPIERIEPEQGDAPIWRLCLGERLRILQGLHGVDLDPQAVEVTRLSLVLMAFEGYEGSRVATDPPDLLDLAVLADHIRHGNALVDPDFVSPTQPRFLERMTENPDVNTPQGIDWRSAFPEVFRGRRAGFDVVLGNPPYGAELDDATKEHLATSFDAGTTDTAALTMLRASQLTRTGGWIGMIVPKPFLYASSWERVRAASIDALHDLVDVGCVWPGVKLEQAIYLVHKGRPTNGYNSLVREDEAFVEVGRIPKRECRRFGLLLNDIDGRELAIGRVMHGSGRFLGDLTTNTRGAALRDLPMVPGPGRRVIGGRQIRSWRIEGERGRLAPRAPAPKCARVEAGSILVQNILAHINRPLHHIQIIATAVDATAARRIAILDTVNQLVNRSDLSSDYLLGLLMSRPVAWYVYRFVFAKAVRTMHFDGPVSDRIPVPGLDLSRARDRTGHDEMAELARRMTALHERPTGPSLKLAQTVRFIQDKIDRLACELYGLDEDQIEAIWS